MNNSPIKTLVESIGNFTMTGEGKIALFIRKCCSFNLWSALPLESEVWCMFLLVALWLWAVNPSLFVVFLMPCEIINIFFSNSPLVSCFRQTEFLQERIHSIKGWIFTGSTSYFRPRVKDRTHTTRRQHKQHRFCFCLSLDLRVHANDAA